jgi:chromosome segregation ATPase
MLLPASERAANQLKDEQQKTQALQVHVEEMQPQVKELTNVLKNLADLESSHEKLLASLKQQEEAQDSELQRWYATCFK